MDEESWERGRENLGFPVEEIPKPSGFGEFRVRNSGFVIPPSPPSFTFSEIENFIKIKKSIGFFD